MPARANPDGEVPELRERLGADPLVWTDAMLAALESEVKGGKWFSLKDKLYRPRTLRKVRDIVNGRGGGSGVDKENLHRYGKKLDQRLSKLETKPKTGRYEPKPAKSVFIPKAGGKQTCPQEHLRLDGRMGANAIAQHPEKTSRTEGTRPGKRPSALSKRVLRQDGTVQP